MAAATLVAGRLGPWLRGALGRGALLGRAPAPGPQRRGRSGAEPGPWPPGLEYIPKKKAKNPMKAVGLAWAVGFPCGILLFLFTKREVDKNRLKQMKALHNMRTANSGHYETQRFQRSGGGAGERS